MGGNCLEGLVVDCSNPRKCCTASWIGDHYADCGQKPDGCDLTCYDMDGGDCVPGCSDADACNFDADATVDDGSCDFSCIGCMDEGACNYDSTATKQLADS